MVSLRLVLALAVTLLLVSCVDSERKPVLRHPASSPKTGCYIIGIKEKATEEEVQALLTSVTKASDDHKMYGLVRKVTRAFTVKLSPYSLEIVRRMPAVEYIEEEGYATGDLTDDIMQWHLDRLDQAAYPLDLNYAPIGNGEGVDIFILDTGINYDHVEFERRAKYVGRDPMDDYSIDTDIENYQRQYGRDCHGHGTHVSSLSGGKTYGSAKKATLYSVRVLNCNNAAPWSVVLNGLEHVQEMVQRTKRPSIVSMSLSGDYYRSVNDAVATLDGQGVHIVVAAGNGERDACTRSPASSSLVTTVGGSRNGDGFYLLGAGSNFGPCVDIFAPGERILGADWKCTNCCKVLSGTSMAAPIVSGVVAVFLSKQPMTTPADMKSKLVNEAMNDVLSFDGVNAIFHDNTVNKLLNIPGSCGGSNFFRTYIPLKSPGYPQPYPSNLDCLWHIKVDAGQEVVVNVSQVRLEGNYDTLRLYEGTCCNETHLVAEFTGDLGAVDYMYTSARGEVSLQLLTDGTGSAPGFTGSFTKVYTGTTIRVPEPDIELPALTVATRRPHVVTLHSLSPKRARAEVADLLSKGYKVTWITTRVGVSLTSHAFDVILSNSTKVDTRVFIDLTDTQLNTTVHNMAREGYSLKALSDRERGRPPKTVISYTALFARANYLLETKIFPFDTLAAWQAREEVFNNTGHTLISQSYVNFQGQPRVSTVYTLDRRLAYNITFDPPAATFAFHNASFFDFTRQALTYARKDYYLSYLEVHDQPGVQSARFSGIMIQHTDRTIRQGHWFRWGLDETAFELIVKTESHSWDPYLVSGYAHQGNVLFYAGFKRTEK